MSVRQLGLVAICTYEKAARAKSSLRFRSNSCVKRIAVMAAANVSLLGQKSHESILLTSDNQKHDNSLPKQQRCQRGLRQPPVPRKLVQAHSEDDKLDLTGAQPKSWYK
jgi:hypothetical protein